MRLIFWSDHSITPTLQNAAAICKTQWFVTLGEMVSMGNNPFLINNLQNTYKLLLTCSLYIVAVA